MYISWDDYQSIKDPVMDKVNKFLKPEKFPNLESRSRNTGKVAIIRLFNYVMRKVWIQQTRIGLSLYDPTGQGYLRETDLEAYIFELIPSLTQLDGLEKSFHSFYVCTAVRKFFFFLDPLRTGKIRIKDVLKSNFLDELLEVNILIGVGIIKIKPKMPNRLFSSSYGRVNCPRIRTCRRIGSVLHLH